MNLQEVTYYLLFVTTVKSAVKTLVKLTLKVCIHSSKLKMLLLTPCSVTSKTSSLTTVVSESKNLVTHLKVVAAEAAKEEATVVAVNVKVTAVVSVKAMVVATEEVLAAAADVKAQAAVAVDSEISLVNHVKAEAQQAEEVLAAVEKEDADLNIQHTYIEKARIYRAFFCLTLFYIFQDQCWRL